jgi:hypothetical protein
VAEIPEWRDPGETLAHPRWFRDGQMIAIIPATTSAGGATRLPDRC